MTILTEGDVTHRLPYVVPGTEAVVFTAHSQKDYGYDDAKVMLSTTPRGDHRLFSASYSVAGSQFSVEPAVQWDGVEGSEMLNQPNWAYDRFAVDPNRSRVLVRRQARDEETETALRHVVLFENIFDFLREKVPETTGR